jgi:CheY-like chemotaxis protein
MAKILVIDDEATIRTVIRRTLERAGHTVSEAGDGEIGLKRVKEELPDLVITDLIMPEREGIETIQVLRSDYPTLRILAISGTGPAAEGGPLMDAELFGADDSLAKPFTAGELQECVRKLLAKG